MPAGEAAPEAAPGGASARARQGAARNPAQTCASLRLVEVAVQLLDARGLQLVASGKKP